MKNWQRIHDSYDRYKYRRRWQWPAVSCRFLVVAAFTCGVLLAQVWR